MFYQDHFGLFSWGQVPSGGLTLWLSQWTFVGGRGGKDGWGGDEERYGRGCCWFNGFLVLGDT